MGNGSEWRNRIYSSNLFKAVESSEVSEVRQLLDDGIDPDSRQGGVDQMTALMGAALDGNMELVRILFEAGASVNARDDVGRTPIHFAAWGGSLEVYDFLVRHGADFNHVDATGLSTFQYAAFSENVVLVSRLIRDGHNVNFADDILGQTALHHLVEREEPPLQVIEILLSNGADATAKDHLGKTPLMILKNRALLRCEP